MHFILALIFAYLIRGNLIAALIGTVVGNPLTFPFIWGLIYQVGTYVTSIKHSNLSNDINFEMIINQTYEIFFPMFVGGIIIAPFVWVITYLVIYSFISSYKKRPLDLIETIGIFEKTNSYSIELDKPNIQKAFCR